jgi:hypothetical protein
MARELTSPYKFGGADSWPDGIMFVMLAPWTSGQVRPLRTEAAILLWRDSQAHVLDFVSEFLFFATVLLVPGTVALYQSLVHVDRTKAATGCGIIAATIRSGSNSARSPSDRPSAIWCRLRTDFVMVNVSSFAALTRCLDNEASVNESDRCAGASLDRVVCENERCPAKNDSGRDDDDEPHDGVLRHKGASPFKISLVAY